MTSVESLGRRDLRGPTTVLGLVLVTVVLRVAGATREQISAAAADPQGYVNAAGADEFVLVLATAIGWLVLAWVCLGAVLVLGSLLPGWIGWLFTLLARLLLPATLRRFVSLALGLAMLSGTSVASAAPTAIMSPISVQLDWPGAADAANASVPDWPPVPSPSADADQPSAPGQGSYIVQSGDCLWDIAERLLAQAGRSVDVASVAAAVTQWWQANDSQIVDPDLIFPGQVLQVPAS